MSSKCEEEDPVDLAVLTMPGALTLFFDQCGEKIARARDIQTKEMMIHKMSRANKDLIK